MRIALCILVVTALASACGDEITNAPDPEGRSCGEGTTVGDGGACVPDVQHVASECGPGTMLSGGACVAVDTECGEGTSEVDGQCVPSGALTCAPGTFPSGEECVAVDPDDDQAPTTTASPEGGIVEIDSFLVTLTADEPATIYYTLDGSDPDMDSRSGLSPLKVRVSGVADGDVELKFFAVDAAGNAEDPQTETYSPPPPPPPPVSGLGAELTGADATITWTNPDFDAFAGVIVVRTVGAGAGSPVNGETYDVGDTLPDGGEVIYAGTGEEADDADIPVGRTDYAVFVIDDAGNYSPYRLTSVLLAMPSQSGTISIDLVSLEVTVTEQPDDLDITPVADATWAGVGNPLSFQIEVRNDLPRILFALKGIVTAINDGAATVGNEDGAFDGDPYFYFGDPVPAIDVGKKQTITISIDGVTGTPDPLTIDLDFRSDPLLFGGESEYNGHLYANDGGGTGESYEISMDGFGIAGNVDGNGSDFPTPPLRGVVSPDGRHLYYGQRNQPAITIVDTATMSPWESWDLTGANNIQHLGTGEGSFGFTRAVEMSPDGKYVYVTLMTNEHCYDNSYYGSAYNGGTGAPGEDGATIEIVKLDRLTLDEVGRIVLMRGVFSTQGGRVALSADGSRAAVAVRVSDDDHAAPGAFGRFFVIDTESMEVVDANPAPGNQSAPFDISDHGTQVREVALSPDGSTVYVHMADGDTPEALWVVDLETRDVTSVTPPTYTTGSYTTDLRFGPDGRVYWTTYYDLRVYHPGDDTWFEHDTGPGDEYFGVRFAPDGSSYYVFQQDEESAEQFDISDDSMINNPADGSSKIPTPGNNGGHAQLITPF